MKIEDEINSYFPELLKFARENDCEFISCQFEGLYCGHYLPVIYLITGYIHCLSDNGKISYHLFNVFYSELDAFEEDYVSVCRKEKAPPIGRGEENN